MIHGLIIMYHESFKSSLNYNLKGFETMIKLDINKYLTSKTFNLDNVTYNNIKVLDMNLNQLKNVCKDFGFTTFLSESKSQTKLAKNLKELNMYSIGIAIAPYELIKDFNNNNYHKDILDYLN